MKTEGLQHLKHELWYIQQELKLKKEKCLWVSIYEGWKYCPQTEEFSKITEKDLKEKNIIDLNFYFEVDETQWLMQDLLYRQQTVKESWQYLKQKNPHLSFEELEEILPKFLQEDVLDKYSAWIP